MRALLDVNVLVALFDAAHVHHETCRAWLVEHQQAGWASCPLTQNGAIRILSTPTYPNTVSTSEAARLLAGACGTSHHAFWPDDLSILDASSVRRERIHGPRQIIDVHLLALAVARDGRLVTLDGAIPLSPVIGAQKRHLIVLR